MAGNTGKKHRKGAIPNRRQTYDKKKQCFVKIDTETNKIIGSKKTAFKGVRKDEKAKAAVKKG